MAPVCASRSRGLARSTLVLGRFFWVGLRSRSVCDADAGGTDASYGRRGKRTEQATNSAGLRSLGLGCCTGERRKPGRASSDARVPGGVTHFDLRWGPQARLQLARRRIRVWSPSVRPCASLSTQSAQRVWPECSRCPRRPRSRGRRGDVRVPAQRDAAPPPPAALGSAGISRAPQPPPPGGGRRRAWSWRSLLARNQARHRASQLL